ncbi:MAG: hypothetical protein GXP35_17665, partial [Actinobacteria bacterium]|nr:hypothetical protein [Actinomycetota bacterium]
MSVLLGALGSLLIGTSDLFGRRSSGQSSPMATVLVSFGVGAFVAGGLAVTLGHSPRLVDLGLGAASG